MENGKEMGASGSNESGQEQQQTAIDQSSGEGTPAISVAQQQESSNMVQDNSAPPLTSSVEKLTADANAALEILSGTIQAKLSESPANSSKTVEMLREIDLEICSSLPESGPRDHNRAVEALNRLTTLPAPPTAEELLIAKELLITLNKIRKYQFDETIRNKAVLHYNRLKNICLNANLSQYISDQ